MGQFFLRCTAQAAHTKDTIFATGVLRLSAEELDTIPKNNLIWIKYENRAYKVD